MRYMLLVYTNEAEMDGATPELVEQVARGHRLVMEEARRAGVFVAAEPLAPTRSATTVRMVDGQPLVIDGPFAETKEQLAGYYVVECRDLDEAIEWARKLPTECGGGIGSVEIRRCGFNNAGHERRLGCRCRASLQGGICSDPGRIDPVIKVVRLGRRSDAGRVHQDSGRMAGEGCSGESWRVDHDSCPATNRGPCAPRGNPNRIRVLRRCTPESVGVGE